MKGENKNLREIPKHKFRRDKNGYFYAYAPYHTLANKAGKVYEHRYVVWLHNPDFDRSLHVHHKDEDRSNNSYENLELLSCEDHARKHLRERIENGSVVVNGVVSKRARWEVFLCPVCFSIFFAAEGKRLKNLQGTVCCSSECSHKLVMKFNPTKEELQNLVWEMPTVEVAKIYGVSDKAVEKRCKKFGINKPPRGYWAKVKSSNAACSPHESSKLEA